MTDITDIQWTFREAADALDKIRIDLLFADDLTSERMALDNHRVATLHFLSALHKLADAITTLQLVDALLKEKANAP